MEYRSRYQLGDTVQLSVLTTDNAKLPTVPDKVPVAVVSSDTALALSQRLPVQDRYAQTGWFSYPLILDARFAVGVYRVVYQWLLSGVMYTKYESFEVVDGGQSDGPGLSIFFFPRPTSNYVLLQCDSGRVIRRRNPRIA